MTATSKKVLIIEDDVDLVEAVKTVLENRGMEVAVAYRPDEGFALAKREMPDLIILDVMFDKKGRTEGFDLARQIRREKDLTHIPIIIATSVNAEYPGFHFSAKDTEFLPVDDFINKPTSPNELVEKVEKLLAEGVGHLVN
jgi:DNA-binding response OmpR family regulator